MTESEAIQLIHNGVPDKAESSSWVDLGSGSGTFTKALAQLLSKGSTILAVDKENHKILSTNNQVIINFQQADFTSATLPHSLDGILMANSIHYVKDQLSFITRLTKHLKPDGRMLFVEYDTDRSNAWVPYPVSFGTLNGLLSTTGFESVIKIGEKNSIYNRNKMYACVATHLLSS